MENSWIPGWAGSGWTVICLLTVVVYLGHLFDRRGRARLWHGAHILMGMGMMAMFWPVGGLTARGQHIAMTVFVTALSGVLIGMLCDLARRRRVRLAWWITAIELAAMSYMFAPVSYRAPVPTAALVGWFVVEAFGWAGGWLHVVSSSERSLRVADDLADGVDPAESDATPSVSVGSRPSGGRLGPRRTSAMGLPVRISMTLMSVGAAYMLVAMQYATDAGPASVPMRGM
jgi:hypothetical protein